MRKQQGEQLQGVSSSTVLERRIFSLMWEAALNAQ